METMSGKCKGCEGGIIQLLYGDVFEEDTFQCQNVPITPNGFCEFHDADYAKKNPEIVTNLFYEWMERQIREKEIIYCINFFLPKKIYFDNFSFDKPLYFLNTMFQDGASFLHAKFQEGVSFSYSTFNNQVDFTGSNFKKGMIFSYTNFHHVAIFNEIDSTKGTASFVASHFYGDLSFSSAHLRDGEFSSATFYESAGFSDSTFYNKAEFNNVTFHNHTGFLRTKFHGVVSFYDSKFLGKILSFTNTAFYSMVLFHNGYFDCEVEFNGTRFPYYQNGYESVMVPLIKWQELLDLTVKFNENLNEFDADEEKLLLSLRKEGFHLPLLSEITKIEKSQNNDKLIFYSDSEKVTVATNLNMTRVVNNVSGTDKTKEFVLRNETIYHSKKLIPVMFDYSTFKRRVRFIGKPDRPIKLKSVSFKGVDLTTTEFYNVDWLEAKDGGIDRLINRRLVVDEVTMREFNNHQDVSKIYNQLRKNYESRLMFNESSHFFVGEMEAIRISLNSSESKINKMASIGYTIYKWLALYGESIFLPLVVWTIVVNAVFILLRIILSNDTCSLNFESTLSNSQIADIFCTPFDHFIDSLAAYFQFPRSNNFYFDIIERIVSIPILGTAFIAIRRKFERKK